MTSGVLSTDLFLLKKEIFLNGNWGGRNSMVKKRQKYLQISSLLWSSGYTEVKAKVLLK